MYNLFKGQKKTSEYKKKSCKVKKLICFSLVTAMLVSIYTPTTFARQGDSGYEGGISSGEEPSMISTTGNSKYLYDYKEPCFISGIPAILTGTLSLSKKVKTDTKTNTQTLTTTFVYVLSNTSRKANLARTLNFVTTITDKGNGQKTESTILKTATENLKIDNTTYVISNVKDYQLSKSILNDIKPAINFYSGEIDSRKTYTISSAGTTSGTARDTVIVETTGRYYGYDEFWSSAETQLLTQTITLSKVGKPAVITGIANIEVSTTTQKDLQYKENAPNHISFSGGYVQTQKNNNVLKYTANLSELDKNKVPTSKVVTYSDSLKLESAIPSTTRLVSPNLTQIKGHPSEENIALMFGLEAYKSNDAKDFDPQEYMSRAEFVDAFINVAKEVPPDPAFVVKASSRTKKNTTVESAYSDVPNSSIFINSINTAAKRGIVSGDGKSKFRPNDLITYSEAVNILINALGLRNLAPKTPITSFKDNASIPNDARAAMYVADKLGLISEDAKGYIYPKKKLTRAAAADLMKSYIDYMNDTITKEYKDKLISY